MSLAPPIRPAATVILLRDGSSGLEVFMLRRHDAAAFMAGAHVFPGGRVDPSDHGCTPDWCKGVEEAHRQVPDVDADAAAAFCVAAMRELFEEAGVLMARGPDGELLSLIEGAERERFLGHRHDVHAARRTFQAVLKAEHLHLALDTLTAFAHWVTPPGDTRRFDTRFFAARMPPRQTPDHDQSEATHGTWIAPSEAIRLASLRDVVLPPPTWVTLRELEPFATVSEALRWAGARRIVRREPKILEQNGSRVLVLPGDPLHPEAAQPPIETRFVWTSDRWSPETLA